MIEALTRQAFTAALLAQGERFWAKHPFNRPSQKEVRVRWVKRPVFQDEGGLDHWFVLTRADDRAIEHAGCKP
ncbi:MAG TPA: hypothetical protein VFC19_09665 [Candidatus Limnocylindrales bacterium]|nr:hypothetical protein [Candidatus Limnocylindrales bacterium]